MDWKCNVSLDLVSQWISPSKQIVTEAGGRLMTYLKNRCNWLKISRPNLLLVIIRNWCLHLLALCWAWFPKILFWELECTRQGNGVYIFGSRAGTCSYRQLVTVKSFGVGTGSLDLQLDCFSWRRTGIINLASNQKGYDNSETKVGRLSARRIQIFPGYFCLGNILKVILNNFQHNTQTKIARPDSDLPRQIP